MRLIATKRQRYARQNLKAGDMFTARNRRDFKFLKEVGLAKDAPPITVAEPFAGAAAAVPPLDTDNAAPIAPPRALRKRVYKTRQLKAEG